MRDTFSDFLVEATQKNPRVYLLTGDHGYALFDAIRKKNPDHYINAGVAEQNMVGVAAGMAKAGLHPVVYGLSAFLPIRVLEQIKLDICFENLPVILMGDGAGVVYSKLGVSHQCSEDVAALRALPNMRILSPCDKYEMKLCLESALENKVPTYIRMGKSDLGDVHANHQFAQRPGLHLIKKGSAGAPVFFASGSMVSVGQKLIQTEFKDFTLYSVSELKPIREQEWVSATKDSSLVITMEEHTIYGGLGSLVSEVLSTHSPKRVLRLGIQDRFTDKCGTYEHLMVEHGLDAASLARRIKAVL